MASRRTNLLCRWAPLVVLAPTLGFANPDTDRLEADLTEVKTAEFGKASPALARLGSATRSARSNPDTRASLEQKLLDALMSATTRAGREMLCRQLIVIGTPRCIPVIEAYLTDPEMGHSARAVLTVMNHPEATRALRDAIPKTKGTLQAGLIDSIGTLRDESSTDALSRLFTSSHQEVALAAIRAVGEMGGTRSAALLKQHLKDAKEHRRNAISAALIRCAERLIDQGKGSDAEPIFEAFHAPDQPDHLRIAGLRGLARLKKNDAIPLLLEAARDPRPEIRSSAIALMVDAPGRQVAKAFVEAAPQLPPPTQARIVKALGERGERYALPWLNGFLQHESEIVRVAALNSLGFIGDESCVPKLVQTAALARGKEETAALVALHRLKGSKVDHLLLSLLKNNHPTTQAKIIHALADRRSASAVQSLHRFTRHENSAVRHETFRALGVLAPLSKLPWLFELSKKPRFKEDAKHVERAIKLVLERHREVDIQAKPILDALAKSPNAYKAPLVALLHKAPSEASMKAATRALENKSVDIRMAAIQTLSAWPSDAPADALFKLAGSSRDKKLKVLALRGYLRLAAFSKEPEEHIIGAVKLAERVEDKKLLLAGLANGSTLRALEVAESFLNNQPVRNEAAQAALQIADRIKELEPERVRKTLKKVIEISPERRLRRQAEAILEILGQYEGYVLDWTIVGPYDLADGDAEDVFAHVFPPESGESQEAAWEKLSGGIGTWAISLRDAVGDRTNSAAYLQSHVWSARKQPAQLEIGSDDGVKVWLNDTLVLEHFATRGVAPGQNMIKAKLNKGWNSLRAKVVNGEGPWGFCCRVRGPDGRALTGVRFSAKP